MGMPFAIQEEAYVSLISATILDSITVVFICRIGCAEVIPMTESNWRIVELADGDDILITHDELEGRIKKLAGLLSEKGIKPGDRICQYMDNCAEVIVLRQACKRVGAYIIAINFHFSAEEAGYIIRDCGARALFIHKKYAQVCSRAIQGIYTLGASGALGDRLFSVGGATGEFSSYEQAVKDARVFNETHRNIQTPGISYTAGTTGQPKGVIRKQDSEGDFKKKTGTLSLPF